MPLYDDPRDRARVRRRRASRRLPRHPRAPGHAQIQYRHLSARRGVGPTARGRSRRSQRRTDAAWRFIRITDTGLRHKIHALVDEERQHTAAALGTRASEFLALKVEGILECAELLVVALGDGRDSHVFGRRTMPHMDLASVSCAIQKTSGSQRVPRASAWAGCRSSTAASRRVAGDARWCRARGRAVPGSGTGLPPIARRWKSTSGLMHAHSPNSSAKKTGGIS